MSHTLKPAPEQSIFRISNDFSQLMLLREIMASENEDTAAIDGEIANYFARDVTREKIDTVINFLRYAGAQEIIARNEAKRTKSLASRWEAQIAFLKDAAKAVLENSGQKALEGNSAGKLILKGNGSVQPLEITDASLIPEELVQYTLRLSGDVLVRMGEHIDWNYWIENEDVQMERVPHNERIRAELEKPCDRCDGSGRDPMPNCNTECLQCDGAKTRHVPGARLLERGSHVEIK